MNARLLEVVEIADEVRHFVFEAETENFSYVPGQFVSLTDVVDGKKITRAYSIASPPRGSRFELCLNRVKEGRLSPRLFALRPGDAIEMGAPLGFFVLRQPLSDSVMVATGTGIAPFRSMLQAHFTRPSSRIFTLIFGVRYQHNLMYREEFETLAREYPAFRFWPTLSRPEDGWQGRRGHVQEHIPAAIGERRDVDIYICGLKLMVDDVRGRLKETGFDRKRLIYEKYD